MKDKKTTWVKSKSIKIISQQIKKENYYIFATFINENFNNMIENSIFLESLKKQILCQYTESSQRMKMKITDMYVTTQFL